MDFLIVNEKNKHLVEHLLEHNVDNIYVNFDIKHTDITQLNNDSIRKTTSDYFTKTKSKKVCFVYSEDVILHNVEKLKKYSDSDKIQIQKRCYTEHTDKNKFTKLCEKHSIKCEYDPFFNFYMKNPVFLSVDILKKVFDLYKKFMNHPSDLVKYYYFYCNTNKTEISFSTEEVDDICTKYYSSDVDKSFYESFCFIRSLKKEIGLEFTENKNTNCTGPFLITRKVDDKGLFNPTAFSNNTDNIILLRQESKVNKKHQCWQHSISKYFMSGLNFNNKSITNLEQLQFVVSTEKYNQITRNNLSKNKPLFEDGRIIHGTHTITNDDEYVLASFGLCGHYDVRYKKRRGRWICKYFDVDNKIAICKVSIKNKTISFLDFLDKDFQSKLEKNWAIFKHKEMYYAIYAWEHKIYSKHKDIKKLKFNCEKPKSFGKLSLSTNPISIGENTFATLLHKKLSSEGMQYLFYLVIFDAVNGEIQTRLTQRINIPSKWYYASSLIIKDEKLYILCGHFDCESLYFVVDYKKIIGE